MVKVTAAFNRKNGKDSFAYYATTDRSMSGERAWKIFRARWKIESLFYDLKNHLNFGRLSVSDDKANELAFVIPFVIITYLRINPRAFGLNEGRTVFQMTRTLRRNQENAMIDRLLEGYSTEKFRLLKNRRMNIGKKPAVQRTEAFHAA